MIGSRPEVLKKQERSAEDRLDTIVVGAGLGGLGAAISILLAGHNVHILESASEISEVGAGIQCLPNSSRVLLQWGLEEKLARYATSPRRCNMINWKGQLLSNMDFHAYQAELGTPFWDFHRANLHNGLLERAVELGATLETNARVADVEYSDDQSKATAVLEDGRRKTADIIIGADGINSRCREILLGKPDPPILTGDLAYRLLLNTEDIMKDPELRTFVEDPQVNYWMGPDAHCVNYVLRGGKLFNMVLLVPDDMPAGANTLAGNVEEMRALFKDWDPRIGKLLLLCDSVYKWRLCIRPTLDPTWSHESGAFTILGDAAHATLPYLASGAGMSLEDGLVLGLCLAKMEGKSAADKKLALEVYEHCRRKRTERIVACGSRQQFLYHVHDGKEQEERDGLFKRFGEFNFGVTGKKGMVGQRELDEARSGLVDEEDPFPWRWTSCGKWLLTYQCEVDVERRWKEIEEKRAQGARSGIVGEEALRAVL
ncbi:FAD/NAD(P)-binding domain-containing protein [Lojkania enalia]|uniref:FAD/NAD(P)-binding domain-containing protein n=1 Tax=Lojkania enalia TaxID=147567 RepID=A0A9P4NBS7_9PLEO|nr:FAD/NAD(P)-binding domain-containing protein [Didymosphaeria enalia]